jgi:hypothetical protein
MMIPIRITFSTYSMPKITSVQNVISTMNNGCRGRYNRTKPEKCFSTEEEAQKERFKKSSR